jgi:hypothetical protein
MEIKVTPPALTAAGEDIRRIAAEVGYVSSQMRSVGAGSLGACGFPDAAGGLEALAERWSGALGRSADGIEGLGTVFAVAAGLYTLTDEISMPSS